MIAMTSLRLPLTVSLAAAGLAVTGFGLQVHLQTSAAPVGGRAGGVFDARPRQAIQR